MRGRDFSPVEYGEADRPDPPIGLVKFRYVDRGLDVASMPLEEQHRAPCLLHLGRQLTYDIALAHQADHLLNLGLAIRWEIGERVDSPVALGKRQHVDGQIERRQEPRQHTVPEKVVLCRLQRERPVPLHVDEAADDEEGERLRGEVASDEQYRAGLSAFRVWRHADFMLTRIAISWWLSSNAWRGCRRWRTRTRR